MQTNNQGLKSESIYRPIITQLWASYMEAIEHRQWSRADHIKAGINHIEAAEIKEVTDITLPC